MALLGHPHIPGLQPLGYALLMDSQEAQGATNTPRKSEEEFEKRTLDAIQRKFGPAGLIRFLMTFRSGKGDYTNERREWQDKLTMEDIERELAVQTNP